MTGNIVLDASRYLAETLGANSGLKFLSVGRVA